MRNIIFIAPPASGKGTQSEMLVDKYDYVHISTGELLRDEINSGSEKGALIQYKMNNGILVDEEIVGSLLKNKLEGLNNKRFILDGYPRSIEQANFLKELLEEINLCDVICIYLDTDEKSLMNRALGRYNCPICGRGYNVYEETEKPLHEGMCDDCDVPLIHREDDNEESFIKRFNTYKELTEPILDFYQKNGILYKVNNGGTPEETFQNIESVIK